MGPRVLRITETANLYEALCIERKLINLIRLESGWVASCKVACGLQCLEPWPAGSIFSAAAAQTCIATNHCLEKQKYTDTFHSSLQTTFLTSDSKQKQMSVWTLWPCCYGK